MSVKANTTTRKLLLEIAKHIETFGENHTHDVLYKERTTNHVKNHLCSVIKMVCDYFSISQEQIINQKGKQSNKRVLATKFICYYAYTHLKSHGVELNEIAAQLNRTKSLVSLYIKKTNELRVDISDGNQYNQKAFKQFDTKISQYIKSLTHKKVKNEKGN